MFDNQVRIIFLDTSIFESENYFESRNINLLFRLANQNLIEIKITDIVYREIKNRLLDHIVKAINAFKKQKINFESEGRILRNIELLNSHFNKLDYKTLKNQGQLEIIAKLEEIIKTSNIEIIDTKNSDITEVFNDYFATKPSFKDGSKKNEFPDAFSLNTIKKWCVDKEKKCIFISNDKDFENYDDDNIDCNYTISTLLELLYKENNDIQYEIITQIYENSIDDIDKAITAQVITSLETQVYEKLNNDAWFEDVDVNFREIEYIDITIALINEIEDNSFTYEMDVDMDFTVDAEYTDLNNAYYDREDGFWFGEERVDKIIKYRANILVYPYFEFDAKTNRGKFIEIDSYEIRSIEEF